MPSSLKHTMSFLFKLFYVFPYVNSRDEMSARAEISLCNQPLDTVLYTGPDPYSRDKKLNSFKTSVASQCKFMIGLDNLITTNHRNSGKSEYDRKLTELDTRIWYHVNGVFLKNLQISKNMKTYSA